MQRPPLHCLPGSDHRPPIASLASWDQAPHGKAWMRPAGFFSRWAAAHPQTSSCCVQSPVPSCSSFSSYCGPPHRRQRARRPRRQVSRCTQRPPGTGGSEAPPPSVSSRAGDGWDGGRRPRRDGGERLISSQHHRWVCEGAAVQWVRLLWGSNAMHTVHAKSKLSKTKHRIWPCES